MRYSHKREKSKTTAFIGIFSLFRPDSRKKGPLLFGWCLLAVDRGRRWRELSCKNNTVPSQSHKTLPFVTPRCRIDDKRHGGERGCRHWGPGVLWPPPAKHLSQPRRRPDYHFFTLLMKCRALADDGNHSFYPPSTRASRPTSRPAYKVSYIP